MNGPSIFYHEVNVARASVLINQIKLWEVKERDIYFKGTPRQRFRDEGEEAVRRERFRVDTNE